MIARLDDAQLKGLHGRQYVEKFERWQSPQRLIRLVDLLDLDTNSDIVDFGCGNGLILECLEGRVASYTGFDFSKDFVAAANRRKAALKASYARFACGSIVNLCMSQQGAFDIGLALDISEHVYDDDWQEIVDAMFVSLRPGGRLYLHTPNAEFVVEMLKARNILLRQFPEHIAVRNAAENCRFLQHAGFDEIIVRYLPHYNVLRLVHPISAVPFFGRYFRARIFIEARKSSA